AQDYTGGYGRGNLQGVIDYYNAQFHDDAKAVGDDHTDFGEEYGPVDIFNANGDYLQWVIDQDPRAAKGAGTAAGDLSGVNAAIAAMLKSMQEGGATPAGSPGSPAGGTSRLDVFGNPISGSGS